MSSNWPLISLAAIVCMKRRFWSVTHGTYNTLCPPITQREAIAAACSGRVAADRAVHENRMPGCGQLRRVSDGVVNVANLVFAMGIGVERTVFGNLRVFQRVRGFLCSRRARPGRCCLSGLGTAG